MTVKDREKEGEKQNVVGNIGNRERGVRERRQDGGQDRDGHRIPGL